MTPNIMAGLSLDLQIGLGVQHAEVNANCDRCRMRFNITKIHMPKIESIVTITEKKWCR